jgi:transposase-like protein
VENTGISILPKRAYHTNPPTRVEELEARVRQLEKENKVLLMERDILEKAATWYAKESE